MISSLKESYYKDKKTWWNKLPTLDEDQLDQLPYEYIKKFGSFMNKAKEIQDEVHLEINKSADSMYQQVKKLNALQTNEEKKDIEDRHNFFKNDLVGDVAFKYTKENYLLRQPRIDLTRYNYNH